VGSKVDFGDVKRSTPLLASQTSDALSFEIPTTCFSRAMYWLSRPIALLSFYTMRYPCLLRCRSLQNSPMHCRELMRDIGGETISITLKKGTVIDGMYFSPERFQKSQESAYKKWSQLFAQPAYQKTATILEIDHDGEDLRTLLGLPGTIEPTGSDDILGVVYCQGAGNIYEFNPQDAVMHLLRGKHVMMFNYSGIMQSKGTPGWEQTCRDAQAVTERFMEKLKCGPEEVVIFGKSMGSGPATWTAVKIPGVDLVYDRGICEMPHVVKKQASCCVRPLAVYAATNFYRYPNESLLPFIQGRVLFMQAVHDNLVDSSHVERLFKVFVAAKLNTTDPEKIDAFAKKFWIKAAGGHSSGDNGEFSWYRDPATQKQLNAFFIKS
jgi:hypothetical protein